jgi:hypothetical protein
MKVEQMPTIHKFRLNPHDRKAQHIELTGSRPEIISVGLDPHGDLCAWALVEPDDPANPDMQVDFYVVATGQPLPFRQEYSAFLGTVLQGEYVWHVYIANKPEKIAEYEEKTAEFNKRMAELSAQANPLDILDPPALAN